MVSIWLQNMLIKISEYSFSIRREPFLKLNWNFITCCDDHLIVTTFLCTKTNTLFTIKSITACLRRNAKKEMVSNYIFPLLNNQGNMKRGFFAFYNFPCNYSGCETSSMIFTWFFIIWVEGEFPFYLLRMMENLKKIFLSYI